jgi:hypothetical protein
VLTFLAVVIGWVFFRADNFLSAMTILKGMAGMNGVSVPASFEGQFSQFFGKHSWLIFNGFGPFSLNKSLMILCLGYFIIWFTPNMRTIFKEYQPAFDHEGDKLKNRKTTESSLRWHLDTKSALAIGCLLFVSIIFIGSNKQSEFLYFQF